MPEEVLWTEGLLSDGRTPQENEGGLENWASMKTGSHGLTRKAWEDNGALPWFARGEFFCLDTQVQSFAWALATCMRIFRTP